MATNEQLEAMDPAAAIAYLHNGHADAPAPAPKWNEADPCSCWSCNRQCGGTVHPQSCGPTADVDGRPVCQACRDSAHVFGSEAEGRAGTCVQVTGDHVRLTVDVFETFKSRTTYLTAASARHLAELLTSAADDLEALASAGWNR